MSAVHTVGLDLVSFQTVVFYEPEYSLYTLWQALMGRKMRPAQTLYGDEVGGGFVPVEEGDFLNDLIVSVLKDDRLERASAIFSTQNDMTASPLGSLTAASPHLNPFEKRCSLSQRTWSEWLAARCQAEGDKRRKSIVFIRHTGNRDIQARRADPARQPPAGGGAHALFEVRFRLSLGG